MGKFRLAVFNTQPPHLYLGGVERRIIESTKRLANQADITIYSGTKGGFKQSVNINGVSFVSCNSTDKLYPLDNWSFNRSLQKKASAYEADVYEAHNVSGYGFPNALIKHDLTKPFIQVIHGPLRDEYEQARRNEHQSLRNKAANFLMRYLANIEEKTAKNAHLIIAVSEYSKNKIIDYYNIDESKIIVVPNGVDPEKFKPIEDTSAAKQKFGLDDEPIVLFVGSLIPRKGLPFLVKAAEKIIKEQPKTLFVIVGTGPLKNQLLDTIEAAKLSGSFRFLGNAKDDSLPLIYNFADVFVLPSIQEGQGIVLLEAQASAKPVVAFEVGGVSEAFVNNETGLLINPGNTDELANGVTKLLSDKALSEKMGANARRFVMHNFTWDICTQRMLRVYREAMGT